MDCRLERLHFYFAFACFSFIAVLNVRIYFEHEKIRKPEQINKSSNDLRGKNITKTKIFKKSLNLTEKCQKYFPSIIQPKSVNIQDIKKMFSNKTAGWVDNNRGIFYCSLPRTASKNWIDLAQAGKRGITSEDLRRKKKEIGRELSYNTSGLIDIKHAFIWDQKQKSENYKTAMEVLDSTVIKHAVISVRHPLVRLFSAWSHIFLDHDTHAHSFTKEIFYMKEYCSEYIKRDTPPPKLRIPFSAFLCFVSQPVAHTKFFLDAHWEKVTAKCKPCKFEKFYDLVSNVEEASSDATEFQEVFGFEGFGKFGLVSWHIYVVKLPHVSLRREWSKLEFFSRYFGFLGIFRTVNHFQNAHFMFLGSVGRF